MTLEWGVHLSFKTFFSLGFSSDLTRIVLSKLTVNFDKIINSDSVFASSESFPLRSDAKVILWGGSPMISLHSADRSTSKVGEFVGLPGALMRPSS